MSAPFRTRVEVSKNIPFFIYNKISQVTPYKIHYLTKNVS